MNHSSILSFGITFPDRASDIAHSPLRPRKTRGFKVPFISGTPFTKREAILLV
jgi:hypothetical protein